MSEGKSPVDRLEERAWASFALHAGQRLTTFNFFIVLSSLLVGAMVTTFQKDFRVPYLGAVVGVLLAMLSFIFWKIDVRNKQLIKLAEKAITHFEELAPKPDGMTYHPAAFFTREAHETDQRKAAAAWWHFSYSKAFAAVYILVACTGIAGALVAVVAKEAATATDSTAARHHEGSDLRSADGTPTITSPRIPPIQPKASAPEQTATGTSESIAPESKAQTPAAPLDRPPTSTR